MNPPQPPPGSPNVGDLTDWRLGTLETDVATIKTDLSEKYATKEGLNDLRRIVYAGIGLFFSTMSLVFASSFHLFTK